MVFEVLRIDQVDRELGFLFSSRNSGHRFCQFHKGLGGTGKITRPILWSQAAEYLHVVEDPPQEETGVEGQQLWFRKRTAICKVPSLDKCQYPNSFPHRSETAGHLKSH